MKSPFELAGPRVKLCENDDYLWERVAEDPNQRGLNEAPQVLVNKGRTFLIYSASSSWQPTYKLGMLELRPGGNPLNPSDWTKLARPVFRSTAQTYGVGHACFVKSPDGKEDWIVFHAKQDRQDGWRRAIFAQRFGWGDAGRPRFGAPTTTGELLTVPSGSPEAANDQQSYSTSTFPSLDDWLYYGHQQLCFVKEGKVHLGILPRTPVNLFRTGEKLLLRNSRWTDLHVEATIKVVAGERDAGILFRVANPAFGYDSQEGYFAGIIPRSQRVILGATDGYQWRHIADAPVNIKVDTEYRLGVFAKGPSLEVELDGQQVLKSHDDVFSIGSVGLRVVDTGAIVSSFKVEPLAE